VPKLVLIGVVAGLFSALFGVGGGLLIVPLLILTAAFPERAASATSLAAIGLTALAGAVAYGIAGYLHFGHAALVGLPAAAGAVAGASLQQRLHVRTLTYAFAALLVGVAIWMLVA
jgi:uncharacterized protein